MAEEFFVEQRLELTKEQEHEASRDDARRRDLATAVGLINIFGSGRGSGSGGGAFEKKPISAFNRRLLAAKSVAARLHDVAVLHWKTRKVLRKML